MPRLRSKHGKGTQYHQVTVSPREIGPCVNQQGCPGTLTSASLAGITVIACVICGDVWYQDKWYELVTELGKARIQQARSNI